MTLIGPRPYLPREKEDMGEYYNQIIQVKPGSRRVVASPGDEVISASTTAANWIKNMSKTGICCGISRFC